MDFNLTVDWKVFLIQRPDPGEMFRQNIVALNLLKSVCPRGSWAYVHKQFLSYFNEGNLS